MPVRFAALALLSSLALTSRATAPVYSISGHIVVAGASVHAASACFGLDAVIGEPVVDASAGSGYALDIGFNYLAPPLVDSIFRGSFEDCTQ